MSNFEVRHSYKLLGFYEDTLKFQMATIRHIGIQCPLTHRNEISLGGQHAAKYILEYFIQNGYVTQGQKWWNNEIVKYA